MKKIILSLAILAILIVPTLAMVATAPPIDALPATWWDSPWDMLENIIDGLFVVLIFAAAITIVIGGYYFLTAGGDPDKVSKARQYIIYALIGVAVAFMARGLVILIEWVVSGN